MNYQSMTAVSLQPSLASVSLPPIGSIEFTTPAVTRSSPEIVQPLPPPPPPSLPPPPPPPLQSQPPPPRVLPPPMPYNYTRMSRVLPLQSNEYMIPQRVLYSGIPSPYHMLSNRVPLPSTADPNLIVAPARHKTKEVKRRTKTGCLTCRKRRIKCDEGRPECRNCMKSKRHCQGYDPVFQNQAPHSIHPAPSSQINNHSNSAVNNQARRYTIDTTSPSSSSHDTSLATSSPREQIEYTFPPPPLPPPPPPLNSHRATEHLLPYLNQPYKMDGMLQGGLPAYSSAGRPRHRIEQICTIPGTKIPGIPPIPPDSVPNLDPIRKVYDVAFAPGLDKLLESNSSQWFAKHGFSLLVADPAMLGLMLAYLTLVSNNKDLPIGVNASLASQEARVIWAMLSLCTRPGHQGGEETDKLARRFRSLEALLSGYPIATSTSSITDFVLQESVGESGPNKGTAFERQTNQRSEEFWKLIEQAATTTTTQQTQEMGVETSVTENQSKYAGMETGINVSPKIFKQCHQLLDGMENRDLIYSLLLFSSRNRDKSHHHHHQQQNNNYNTSHHNNNNITNNNTNPAERDDNSNTSQQQRDDEEEKEQAAQRKQARLFLETEANGHATNQIFATIAGMALRAFPS